MKQIRAQFSSAKEISSNARCWPILAVPVMKSTRGSPTATCDPFRSFTFVGANVGFLIANLSFNWSDQVGS